MLRKAFGILLGSALVIGLVANGAGQSTKKPAPAPQTKPTAVVSDEDYAIYSALIQSLYASGAKLLVLDNYVSGCVPVGNNTEGERAWQQSLNSLPGKLPKLSAQTLADFKSKARHCQTLEAKLTLPVKYVLFSKPERKQIFATRDTKKAWANFHQKYAGATGYVNVSSIGFNEARTQALVNTYRKCGEKCGSEKMVLLTKANGQWSVAATHKIWEL